MFYALLISTGVFSVLTTALLAAMFHIGRFWTLLATYFFSTVVVMALLSTVFLEDIAPWNERFLTIIAVAGAYTLFFAAIRLIDNLIPDKRRPRRTTADRGETRGETYDTRKAG